MKTFKTKKQAISHLESKGWKATRKSLGDLVFTRPGALHLNVLSKLKSGKWHFQAWGAVLPEEKNP